MELFGKGGLAWSSFVEEVVGPPWSSLVEGEEAYHEGLDRRK